MFRSVGTKMLYLIVGVLAMTALVIVLFTKNYVERKLLEAQMESVKDNLYLVKVNVRNHYGTLLHHRLSTVAGQKDEMTRFCDLILRELDNFHRLYEEGALDEGRARRLSLDWVRAASFGDDTHFLVTDARGKVLSHSDPRLIGKSMDALKDFSGFPLVPLMRHKVKTEGEGFATFAWEDVQGLPASKRLVYFKQDPNWDWLVGTAINLEKMESEEEKELRLVLGELRKLLDHMKIGSSGYFFVFDGQKNIVAHPTLSGRMLSQTVNPRSGRLLLDEIMEAAGNPDVPVEHVWKEPGSNGPPRSYITYADYFKTLDWYIASNVPKDEIQLPAKILVRIQVVLVLLIFIVSLAVTYFSVRRISRPLKRLAEYAKALPGHDFSAGAAKIYGIRTFPAKYKDEVGNLAEAFLFMEDALRQYLIDLQESTAAKERIESELRIAREIQMSLLPMTFPPFPDRPELQLYATVRPAREVGGDLYDFFFLDEDKLFFVIGDVSGKGIPASLFMAIAKTVFKAAADSSSNPSEILSIVNDKLARDNDACMFITVFCGTLNVATGELIYSNAGHNPPLFLPSQGEARYMTSPPGMALGLMEGAPFKTESLVLEPCDRILLYTDGVTEATSPVNELYSESRLKEQIHSYQEATVEETTEGVLESVAEFAGDAPQADDITLMILQYTGQIR